MAVNVIFDVVIRVHVENVVVAIFFIVIVIIAFSLNIANNCFNCIGLFMYKCISVYLCMCVENLRNETIAIVTNILTRWQTAGSGRFGRTDRGIHMSGKGRRLNRRLGCCLLLLIGMSASV